MVLVGLVGRMGMGGEGTYQKATLTKSILSIPSVSSQILFRSIGIKRECRRSRGGRDLEVGRGKEEEEGCKRTIRPTVNSGSKLNT